MSEITAALSQIGVLPIITLDRVEDALPTIEALMAGGINCGEITFRTEAAPAGIAAMAKAFPDFLLGAGTVMTAEQGQQALDVGATYLIAPGFAPELAEFANAKGVPLYPGVMTPTDITAAMTHGLTTLKLFPAGAAGGIPLLKAFAGPFFQIDFIPTGGVNADNLADYLALPNVVTCGGSWLAHRSLIQAGNFAEITARAKAAIAISQAR